MSHFGAVRRILTSADVDFYNPRRVKLQRNLMSAHVKQCDMNCITFTEVNRMDISSSFFQHFAIVYRTNPAFCCHNK